MAGHFREFLDDPRFVAGGDRSKVRQVTLCSGKFYHELAARRDHIGRDDVALVRVEQFYPFHAELCKEIIERYPENAQLIYAQEEPRNAGGALFVLDCLRTQLGLNARYLGRPANATPAVGSKRVHKQEQQGLLDTVIGAVSCPIDAKPSTVAHTSHA